MLSFRRHLLLVLLVVLVGHAQGDDQPGSHASEIERLIKRLGSDSFTEREAASKTLEETGGPALAALRKATGSTDPEVRRRAARLVEAILARQRDTTIQRVTTWVGLLRQPPIDLGDGVQVRLGVESTRCSRWSGVLLYAYTEGYDNEQPHEINRDRLGPLWVSVQFEGRLLDAQQRYTLLPRWAMEVDRQKRLLFARPVMIDRPGRYLISVRTEAGKEVGSVTVMGTQDPARPFHPWSPLLLLAAAEHQQIGDQYRFRRTAPAVATNLDRGIALPNLMGDMGLPVDEKTLKAGGPLPTLLPREGKGLKLSLDPKTLLLQVNPGRDIITSRPDWHFLARWWVNGKPFLPQPVRPIPQKGGGMTVYGDEEVSVRLDIDARKLGARPGDRVELQLLYCPSGWLPVENPQRVEQGGSHGFPTLTNRVGFQLP